MVMATTDGYKAGGGTPSISRARLSTSVEPTGMAGTRSTGNKEFWDDFFNGDFSFLKMEIKFGSSPFVEMTKLNKKGFKLFKNRIL
jgi:hypothetical protein